VQTFCVTFVVHERLPSGCSGLQYVIVLTQVVVPTPAVPDPVWAHVLRMHVSAPVVLVLQSPSVPPVDGWQLLGSVLQVEWTVVVRHWR
jgi:hypothetical protein